MDAEAEHAAAPAPAAPLQLLDVLSGLGGGAGSDSSSSGDLYLDVAQNWAQQLGRPRVRGRPVWLQQLRLSSADSMSMATSWCSRVGVVLLRGPHQTVSGTGISRVAKQHLKRWKDKVVKVASGLACKRRALANFHNKTVLAEGQLVAGGSGRLAHRGGKSHTNKWTAAGTCYNSLLVVAGARAAAATRHTLELVAAPAFACRGRQQEHIKTVVARLRTGRTGAEWLWVERCWDETPMTVKFSGTSNSTSHARRDGRFPTTTNF